MSKIYINDTGQGFPLVLVHGYLGSSEMWCLQRDYLSKFFRIISPALPGFGESHEAESLDSINDMANFVINIIDEKKIDKFNLLGHSMGGMIVQEIAKLAGDRINKLICFATGSIGEIPGRFEPINETRKRLKKEGAKISFSRVPKKWFIKGDKDKNYYLCANAVKNVSLETADNALIAMKNWSGIHNLQNIKNETLIVWGDKDTSYNFDQVDTLNKNIKNSRLEIFENCSHNVHLEKPNEFNILVEKFINQ
ncbi:alpha/beta hydrolase [Candidatus Pelagibacter sp.]|jgi:2-hydroxy-6-oxonona-2,4-dienedioate hydrolase|nr:alpha/beta hydrolase [Candidatus Pelagibacter sp.]MDC0354466.1 alpha/beta hydrolase [bacterium]MDA9107740.1 alpha/beta hydrolase [Candidatus Pelagibacter sp.]MDB3959797.1 alpha/beta hydrolase [Candidatus Pelagibacter sp.]MDC0030433.1 alpha/beta hydrolase [Candidatus Pelagibacter sp.]